MSHKNILGQVLSEKINKRNKIRKESKSQIELHIINLVAILFFCLIFLLLLIVFNKNNDVTYSLLLTTFSICFTFSTELKDWTEYAIKDKEYKALNIFEKLIHTIPSFTIALLFLCIFSDIIKFIQDIPDITANILTIVVLIIFSISYTVRTILYEKDNCKKEIENLKISN